MGTAFPILFLWLACSARTFTSHVSQCGYAHLLLAVALTMLTHNVEMHFYSLICSLKFTKICLAARVHSELLAELMCYPRPSVHNEGPSSMGRVGVGRKGEGKEG